MGDQVHQEPRKPFTFTGNYRKDFLEKMGYKEFVPPVIHTVDRPLMLVPIRLAYSLSLNKEPEMKLCRDCDHVDRVTARLSEEFVICNRPTEVNLFPYTSPVTGETIRPAQPILYCKYERALGGCKDAQFFKPRSENA